MQAQLRPPSSLPFTAELHLLTASLLFQCQSHRRRKQQRPSARGRPAAAVRGRRTLTQRTRAAGALCKCPR